MPIRDLAVTLAILATLPFCVLRPWTGFLVWAWISYMNPHRLTWGFAFDLPFGMMVGVCTLLGIPFAADRKPLIWTRETIVLVMLWGWFTVTTLFAMYPESAWAKWEITSKSLLMALLSIGFFQERRRLRLLLGVIAASIGFYGVKGGLFALVTGGHFMVLGPAGSFFEANTELSLVLDMCLPLLFYLAKEEQRRRLRVLLWGAFALTAVAVPFTYSRAGVLGLAAVVLMLFGRDRARWLLIPIGIIGVCAFLWVAPEQFTERMETLRHYESDGSAQLRLMSWHVGYEIACDRPVFGGGFNVFVHRETYDLYLPEYPRAFGHDAHSIYFNLLGEHGWIGVGLFLLLIVFTLGSLESIRRTGETHPKGMWASNYARMLQASLVGWLVAGTFLSAAYFDLAYQLLCVAIILKGIVRRERLEGAEEERALVPAVALRGRSGRES